MAPAGRAHASKTQQPQLSRFAEQWYVHHAGLRFSTINDQMGMAMTVRRSRLVALAAVNGASLLALPTVLQAQSSGALEEIIVTARQREERIEDVPVTITAFTQTDIRNAGIERPQDFIALTPGVSQVQTAEVG